MGRDIPQATRSAALILRQITACDAIGTARGGWYDGHGPAAVTGDVA
jgi:hypothetical protein